MAIETYLRDEVKTLVTNSADLAEWKSKCEELGLTGQLNLAQPEKSPIPFPIMNKAMVNVYETLCPKKEDVADFDGGAIPLKVLSLIALSQHEQYFDHIQVWSDDAKPDPIAVGVIMQDGHKEDNEYYVKQRYIIARWGDELASFAELKMRAIERWVIKKRTECEGQIVEYQERLAKVELLAHKHFEGEWTVLS